MADDLRPRKAEFERRFPALVEMWQSLSVLFKVIQEWLQRVWLSGRATDSEKTVFENDARYLEAICFRKDFTPQEGCEYEWVSEYAKESYKALEEGSRYLDEKADAIIKYLGSGTAIVALGSLVTITRISAWFPLLLLPSIGFSLRAIRLATLSRTPMGRPAPPIREAIRYTEYHKTKDKAEANFLGLWNQCADGLYVVNQYKSSLVAAASRNYYRAVLFLLLPVVVWPIHAMLLPISGPTKIEIVAADHPPQKTSTTGDPR